VLNSIKRTLSTFILHSGFYESIRSKVVSRVIDMDIVPDSTQEPFRRSFEPLIDLFEKMNFDKNALYWSLFAHPHDSLPSGSWARVCFTVSKD
jgi:hypothetical protein